MWQKGIGQEYGGNLATTTDLQGAGTETVYSNCHKLLMLHEQAESEEASCNASAGKRGDPVGIITIEDVLEELLGTEIVDETDQYIDNLRQHRVNTGVLVRGLPRHLRQ